MNTNHDRKVISSATNEAIRGVSPFLALEIAVYLHIRRLKSRCCPYWTMVHRIKWCRVQYIIALQVIIVKQVVFGCAINSVYLHSERYTANLNQSPADQAYFFLKKKHVPRCQWRCAEMMQSCWSMGSPRTKHWCLTYVANFPLLLCNQLIDQMTGIILLNSIFHQHVIHLRTQLGPYRWNYSRSDIRVRADWMKASSVAYMRISVSLMGQEFTAM